MEFLFNALVNGISFQCTGKWYPEEEKRLADVVYQLSEAKPGIY